MTTTASSRRSKRGVVSRRYSDLPPSYDTSLAEPHGFIDGVPAQVPPFQAPPEPLVSRGPSTRDLTTEDYKRPNLGTTSLFLDPSIGQPRATYQASDELLAQCTQFGHVEKTKFGAWGIFAAAVFFPWGLMCLMNSRLVYCERCGLVLRAPRCKGSCGRNAGKRRARD